MEGLSLVFGISNMLVGLLTVGLSYPLLKDRIPMNGWYGMRFRKSFQSSEAWYAINRYGAGRMIRWSVVLILVGIAGFFIPVDTGSPLYWGMALAPLVLMVPCFESWLYARRF